MSDEYAATPEYNLTPDHKTLEEFVRALAKATEYKSWDTGPCLSMYWKEEAESWVAVLDRERAEVKANIEDWLKDSAFER